MGSSDEFPGEAWYGVFFRAYSREHHKHVYMATGYRESCGKFVEDNFLITL